MKVRTGFVANSSSTSFYFCVAPDVALEDKIFKYRKHFNLSMEDWNGNHISCNAIDIVDSIEGLDSKVDIDNLINNLHGTRDMYKEWAIEEDNRRNNLPKQYIGHLSNHYIEDIIEIDETLELIEKTKQLGLTSIYEIGFGDNHGDISGGDVGNCMDYKGRNIKIDESDFIVFTRQNR